MKINADGQIAIPQELLERFGLTPGTDVDVEVSPNGLLIKPAPAHREGVAKWLRDSHGEAMAGLTTDQVMSLLKNEG